MVKFEVKKIKRLIIWDGGSILVLYVYIQTFDAKTKQGLRRESKNSFFMDNVSHVIQLRVQHMQPPIKATGSRFNVWGFSYLNPSTCRFKSNLCVSRWNGLSEKKTQTLNLDLSYTWYDWIFGSQNSKERGRCRDEATESAVAD